MDLIKRCRNKLLKTNHRIDLNIMTDEKKGATNQIVYKKESVEEKLRNKENSHKIRKLISDSFTSLKTIVRWMIRIKEMKR